MRQNRWLDSADSVFASASIASAAPQNGGHRCASAAGARSATTSRIYLASDIDFPDDMAEAFWLADTRSERRACGLPRLALRGRDVAGRRDPRRGARGCGGGGHSVGGAADRAAPGTRERDLAALAKAAGIDRGVLLRAERRAHARRYLRREAADAAKRASCAASCGPRIRICRAAADVVAAVAALQRSRHRRHRLLQLRPHEREAASTGSATALAALGDRRGVQGKVVAITGAAGGIGQELCRYFGGEGAAIAALDRSPAVTSFAAELRKARDRGRSRGRRHRRRGRREGCLRPARGRSRPRRHPDQQRRRLEQSEPGRGPRRRGLADDVNANLNGAYNCCYAVLPGMKARKPARSSTSARSTASPRSATPPTAPPRPA